jgi:chromosomal replication initiation ATPase DnaA
MIRPESQLPLGLGHSPALSRADFVVGACNKDALAAIETWPDWPDVPVLLTGPEGSGKTHLVRIWAERSGAETFAAAGLDAHQWNTPTGERPLAVEDVDRAEGQETALFHLLNRARERCIPVLLTARDEAIARHVALPDLASRLRAARPARLLPPDDAFLRQVLVKLFADRQLFVTPALLEYLVRRMERTFAAAALLVASMDEAALAHGKPLTRQLAAAVLADLYGDDADPPGVTEAK